jgi:hypothetical protein
MAGTGKSTIARTVAASFHDRQRLTDKRPLANEICLGASFFFNQIDSDRKNSRKLFTTLARHLVEVLPALKDHICAAITEQGNIGRLSLSSQWKHLIFQPLMMLEKYFLSPLTLILVIDALDECEE